MGIIDGTTVLITGASSGIGMEFAKQLAPKAKQLVLVARKADKLERLAEELKSKNPNLTVFVEPCDLSKTEEIERLVNSILNMTQVDILINNAGLGDFAFIDKSKWERNLQMIQVNITALTLLTYKFVPLMVARGKGGIINIGSGASCLAIPGAAIYTATKHYVNGFTESLSLDLAGTGVVVTQICPGPVGTDGQMKALSKGPSITQISPHQCVKEAIDGFSCKKEAVYPGFIFRWLIWFYSFVPTWAARLVGKGIAMGIRSQEQKLIEKKTVNAQ